MNDQRITYFATTDARHNNVRFGIRAVDRDKHMYVIGKTGMGKSTMLENMAAQDINDGAPVIFIDPHGTSAEKLLDHIPEERINDVLYFSPADTEHPIPFNILDDVDPDKRHVVVRGLVRAFERFWVDPWSSKVGYILQNALLAVVEDPDSTLLDVGRLFTDEKFRAMVAQHVQDPVPKAFLQEEFPAYTEEFKSEISQSIVNNLNRLISDPVVRNIINHPDSSFKVRDFINNHGIIIVNLAKGKIGDDQANFFGSMLVTRIYHAILRRAHMHDFDIDALPMTYMYVDEFQTFSNRAFIDIFSESRKYRLALTVAHQYTGQMSPEMRNAILGNVGTIVSFCVGSEDAPILESEFKPTFERNDLCGLGLGHIYLKLMIEGKTSEPFSAETLPPLSPPRVSHKDQIIAASRAKYSVNAGEVYRKH